MKYFLRLTGLVEVMKSSSHKNRICCVLLLLALSLLSGACSRSNDELTEVDEGLVNVDWVLYGEQEQGSGPYPVRMLVNRQYLRFDDNYDASDFLLLDRRTGTLFSVSHEERSILVIGSQSVDAGLPADIVLTEERVADGDAPKIAGQTPLHVRFRANDKVCYEAFVIPGVQQEMVAALTEYLKLEGRRLLQTLDTVPKAMQSPCFLSRYVYRPARHMLEGLPVREWDAEGYQRTLVDYGEKLQVPGSLFVLPDGYTQTRLEPGSPEIFHDH